MQEAERLGNVHGRLLEPAKITRPILTRHGSIADSDEPVGCFGRHGDSLAFAHCEFQSVAGRFVWVYVKRDRLSLVRVPTEK